MSGRVSVSRYDWNAQLVPTTSEGKEGIQNSFPFHFILLRESCNLFPQCRKFRPPQSPTEDPRAWWKFVTKSIVGNLKEEKRKWTAKYISQRRRDRLEYIKLYRLKLLGYTPDPRLAVLERAYSFEDLL